MRKILVVNHEKCSGCRSCEAFCSLLHEKEINPEKSRIRIIELEKMGAIYAPAVCLHCVTPLCRDACPINALYEDRETGAIVVKETCIGCRLCVYACPFGGIIVDEKKGAIKCDLCNGDPICVRNCTAGALEYISYDRVGLNRKRAGLQKLSKFLNLVMGE